nr:glycine-rich protein [Tanacetum cinerariifolium]
MGVVLKEKKSGETKPMWINALFSQGPRRSAGLARMYVLWNIASFVNVVVAFICGYVHYCSQPSTKAPDFQPWNMRGGFGLVYKGELSWRWKNNGRFVKPVVCSDEIMKDDFAFEDEGVAEFDEDDEFGACDIPKRVIGMVAWDQTADRPEIEYQKIGSTGPDGGVDLA